MGNLPLLLANGPRSTESAGGGDAGYASSDPFFSNAIECRLFSTSTSDDHIRLLLLLLLLLSILYLSPTIVVVVVVGVK